MEIIISDSTFKVIGILDSFESLIWTDRYYQFGDFEIYTGVSVEMLALLKEDYYITIKESEHTMIIESAEIISDVETGNKLIVTGRSLESILDRRIVWTQTNIDGNLQSAIETILNDNAINPAISDREISNLIFEASTDPIVTACTTKGQYTGDFLYDVIMDMCESNNLGFKITLNSSYQFVFKLYSGIDRSYQQTTNPYVVFSDKFDNIIRTEYFTTNSTLKTVTLIAGEGDGSARITSVFAAPGDPKVGLFRREIFTDARDLSRTTPEGELTIQSYTNILNYRGELTLKEHEFVKTFEGQVDATNVYIYGTDFFIGDVVQVANEYGQEGRSRIVEVIITENSGGKEIYPSFRTIN